MLRTKDSNFPASTRHSVGNERLVLQRIDKRRRRFVEELALPRIDEENRRKSPNFPVSVLPVDTT
jgi:hypothetical protein